MVCDKGDREVAGVCAWYGTPYLSTRSGGCLRLKTSLHHVYSVPYGVGDPAVSSSWT